MENITKFWFLKDFDLFEKMGKKNLMAMVDYFEMINFKKGEVIRLSRANKKVVYFLKKGTIKIVSNENEHTRFIVKKGNVFGELALYEDSENSEEGSGWSTLIEVEKFVLDATTGAPTTAFTIAAGLSLRFSFKSNT